MIDDDVLGLATQLSYYFFLALFPAILFLLAVASFFPLSNITDDVWKVRLVAIGLTLGMAHAKTKVKSGQGDRGDR